MKLKLKMIAAAVAMVSATGAANAALQLGSTNNGSLALFAYNTVTRDYYIRDMGFLMNDFLPTGVTTLSGDGSATGNRTPESGLTLNGTNTPNFADASFSTWMSTQNAADIRWSMSAVDYLGSNAATNVKRMIVSSANPNETALNGQVDVFVATGNAGGLATLFGDATLSMTATGAPDAFDNNFGLGTDSLASLGQAASLFYFARSTGTGSTATQATRVQYGNSAGFATVTLEADGDFVYSLAAVPVLATPIPAAAWLLGSGLLGLGGMARRRKAAAKA